MSGNHDDETGTRDFTLDPNALTGFLALTDAEFMAVRKLVYERFGINLTDEKRALVQGRLTPYLRAQGFGGFSEYLAHLDQSRDESLYVELVNRISTNHTFFFRENEHFDFLRKTALPEIVARNKTRGTHDIRIWSAGCSSGEEPYTIILTMMDHFGAEYGRWDAGVLATDISEKVLAKAREGIYSRDHVDGIPPQLRMKHFVSAGENMAQASEELRSDITFRSFNLMSDRFPFKKPFDIIFCRNVMIYFDQPTKETLVQKFYEATVPGGYLFVGHSESLLNGKCPYQYVAPAIYRRKP